MISSYLMYSAVDPSDGNNQRMLLQYLIFNFIDVSSNGCKQLLPIYSKSLKIKGKFTITNDGWIHSQQQHTIVFNFTLIFCRPLISSTYFHCECCVRIFENHRLLDILSIKQTVYVAVLLLSNNSLPVWWHTFHYKEGFFFKRFITWLAFILHFTCF